MGIIYFKYNEKNHELILFPKHKEQTKVFPGDNKGICYANLSSYLYRNDFAIATINKLKSEAKKIMKLEV